MLKTSCNIHETTHIPKGVEDVCSIFNRDCSQSTVHKRFCYRQRYIPCLSLHIGWPGLATTSLVGDVLEIWPHMDICFAQHGLIIRPSSAPPAACITVRMSSSAWLGMAGGCCRNVQAKEGEEAMLPTPGRIVRRTWQMDPQVPLQSHRKLHDYMAINKHDKHGNM